MREKGEGDGRGGLRLGWWERGKESVVIVVVVLESLDDWDIFLLSRYTFK